MLWPVELPSNSSYLMYNQVRLLTTLRLPTNKYRLLPYWQILSVAKNSNSLPLFRFIPGYLSWTKLYHDLYVLYQLYRSYINLEGNFFLDLILMLPFPFWIWTQIPIKKKRKKLCLNLALLTRLTTSKPSVSVCA